MLIKVLYLFNAFVGARLCVRLKKRLCYIRAHTQVRPYTVKGKECNYLNMMTLPDRGVRAETKPDPII